MATKENITLAEFLNTNEENILDIVDLYTRENTRENTKPHNQHPRKFKTIKSKIKSLYIYLRTTNKTTTESIKDNTNIKSNTQVALIKEIGYKLEIFKRERYETPVPYKTEKVTLTRPILNKIFKSEKPESKPKLTEIEALNKFTIWGDRNGFNEIVKELKKTKSEKGLKQLNSQVKKLKDKIQWNCESKIYTEEQNHYNRFCLIDRAFLPLTKVNRGKPVIFLDIIASKPSFLYYHILKDNEELAEEYKQLLTGDGFYHNITKLIIDNDKYLEVIDNSFKKVINFEDKVKWIKNKFMPTFFDEDSFVANGEELYRAYPLAIILEKEFPGLHKYYSKQLPVSLDKLQAKFINRFADILLNDYIPNTRRIDEIIVPKSNIKRVRNYLNEFIEDNYDEEIITFKLEEVVDGRIVELEEVVNGRTVELNRGTITEPETIDVDEIEEQIEYKSKQVKPIVEQIILTVPEFYEILDGQLIKWFDVETSDASIKFSNSYRFAKVKSKLYEDCYADHSKGIKLNKNLVINKIKEIEKQNK